MCYFRFISNFDAELFLKNTSKDSSVKCIASRWIRQENTPVVDDFGSKFDIDVHHDPVVKQVSMHENCT